MPSDSTVAISAGGREDPATLEPLLGGATAGPAKNSNFYDQWIKGCHEELLASASAGFLGWVANRGLFPQDQWTDRFLAMGKLKREMRQCVGRRPFPWAPLVELRMPLGCTAVCAYCENATPGRALHTNTKASLLESIKVLKFSETIGLCAEWGDPCLHPGLIDAVNQRIENEWLVTRYTFLTNLSATPAVIKALLYTRTLLVHITMSEPAHAVTIMGYKSAGMFEQVLENLKLVCARTANSRAIKVIVQFIVDTPTIPFIAAHYARFKDVGGLHSCRYKKAWKFAGTEADRAAAARQREALAGMKGKVPYDWRV